MLHVDGVGTVEGRFGFLGPFLPENGRKDLGHSRMIGAPLAALGRYQGTSRTAAPAHHCCAAPPSPGAAHSCCSHRCCLCMPAPWYRLKTQSIPAAEGNVEGCGVSGGPATMGAPSRDWRASWGCTLPAGSSSQGWAVSHRSAVSDELMPRTEEAAFQGNF